MKCCLLPDEIREMYYTYTVYRRKIIFTSGSYFKEMLGKVSVERLELGKGTVVKDAVVNPKPDGSGSGEGGGVDENPLG